MTKEYGVTHFTELHRILHKYFLIWRCQMAAPFSMGDFMSDTLFDTLFSVDRQNQTGV